MSSTITVLLLIYCHIAWLTGELHLLSELTTGKVQFLFQTTKQVCWCLASWAMISVPAPCSPCSQNTADIITDLVQNPMLLSWRHSTRNGYHGSKCSCSWTKTPWLIKRLTREGQQMNCGCIAAMSLKWDARVTVKCMGQKRKPADKGKSLAPKKHATEPKPNCDRETHGNYCYWSLLYRAILCSWADSSMMPIDSRHTIVAWCGVFAGHQYGPPQGTRQWSIWGEQWQCSWIVGTYPKQILL